MQGVKKVTQMKFDKFQVRKNFKQDLVAGATFVGEYGLPQIKKTAKIPENLIPFHFTLSEKSPAGKWVHFYIDDYQFERLWNRPERYLSILKRFAGVITPDFSMFADPPKARRIYNCYRNRALAYWLQKNGIEIVLNIGWAEYADLAWCLDGVPRNTVIAVGLSGNNKNRSSRYGVIRGIEKICREIQPKAIVCYGNEIAGVNQLHKNVIWFDNYCKMMRNRI